MRLKSFFLIFLFLPNLLISSQSLTFTSVYNSQIAKVTRPILIEAYKRLGIKITIASFSAKRSLYLANKGQEFDGESHRITGINNQYPNLVQVPVPIYDLEGIVISKKERFKVDGWESIRPFIIGLRRGIIFAENGTKGMTRSIVYSNEQLFNMLNANRFDLIILIRINSVKFMSQEENKNLMILEPPVEVHRLYHYLHKKNTHLVPKLTKVLQQMKEEGLMQEHKDKFMKQLEMKEEEFLQKYKDKFRKQLLSGS